MIYAADVSSTGPRAAASPPEPAALAARVLADNTQGGRRNVAEIKRDLDALDMRDPALGQAVRQNVDARLSAVERGQLASATYGVQAPDGRGLTITADAMPMPEKFAQAPGSPERQTYDRFDRLWGDGNLRTNDTPAIEAGIRDMLARNLTLAQVEGERAAPPASSGQSTGTLIADLTQLGLDLTGIVDPTPVSDGSNTVISLGRALGSALSGEGREALGHLGNGVLSAAGILPVLGDLAKAGKIGKWAQTVSDAVAAVASSPALRGQLEPLLRKIHDAVKAIPQSAIEALPQSARESLDRMRTQLDEFFGAGAATTSARLHGSTLVFDANKGATYSVGGATGRIGDTPAVRTSPDGRSIAQDVDGNDVTLRAPATYDTRVVNANGSVTYTKDGQSVTYDRNGFPIFPAKADLHLDAFHIKSGRERDHFKAANQMLGDALRADPSLSGRLGLTPAQVDQLTRQPPLGTAPEGLTWHHHEDTGRMQLVDRETHRLFSGGHTGGMKLWGGGRH